MTDPDTLDDLDLLALADGRLDDDPARKTDVEAAVARCPGAAARLADYRAQTAALRAAYAGKLAEPVPERLQAVVRDMDRPRSRPVMRRAAAGFVAVAAGVGGWFLGQEGGDSSRQALLDESYRQFVLRGSDPAASATGTARQVVAPGLDWGAEDVAIRLSAPDLSSEGFALVEKRALRDGDDQIVALDYAAQDGKGFSLFIAPRWENRPGPIVDEERDGVTLAYWHDGPLASSIATHLPQEQARRLAESVRKAMQDETTAPPAAIEPDFRPLDTPPASVLAETLGDTGPRGTAETLGDTGAREIDSMEAAPLPAVAPE